VPNAVDAMGWRVMDAIAADSRHSTAAATKKTLKPKSRINSSPIKGPIAAGIMLHKVNVAIASPRRSAGSKS
jgi:hypothetical protein